MRCVTERTNDTPLEVLMRQVAVCAALAACSVPEKYGRVPDDSRSPDSSSASDASIFDVYHPDAGGVYACIGKPFPINAPASITFQGFVNGQTLMNPQSMPVSNAFVRGFSLASGQEYLNTSTDANGAFSMAVQTNAMAIDGYIELLPASGQTYVPTYRYPRQPFHGDETNLQLGVYDQQTVQAFYQAAGVDYDAQTAMIVAQIVDCNGDPIAGARLVPAAGTQPPRAIRYLVAGNFDPDATSTDPSGLATAFGVVQASDIAYTATTGVGQFHTYRYQYAQGAVIHAVIQP
jgi:hypothetical protein